MASDLDRLRDKAARVLAGVHLAAQGYPYPFWPSPGQPGLSETVLELGEQLTNALYVNSWVVIHCATQINHAVAQPKAVATLHGGRLLVTQTDRVSRLPLTRRRIDRFLVTDLRLLAWEARRGVTRRCPQCQQPHQLRIPWLANARTHVVTSQPAATPPSPAVYPDVEDAAFAEILGPLNAGLSAVDQLWIGLSPNRETNYRHTYADRPDVLTYAELISNRKDLLIQDDPTAEPGYTQTSLGFSSRPNTTPATARLREHKAVAETNTHTGYNPGVSEPL